MHAFSDFYIPDSVCQAEAHARCSHLGIGAHADDLEFMAYHGISACYQAPAHWFGGILCTAGNRPIQKSEQSQTAYAQQRIAEQRAAAQLGAYSFVHQMGYASEQVQTIDTRGPIIDAIEQSLLTIQPDIVYTHNPVDQHPSHRAVCQIVLEAIQRIPPYSRPKRLYGCELWGSLDWLAPQDKIAMDVSTHPQRAQRLNHCFKSQIEGGKNYAAAVIGRRRANATFQDPYTPDQVEQLWLAMDLSPLLGEADASKPVDLVSFVQEKLRTQQNKMLEALTSIP